MGILSGLEKMNLRWFVSLVVNDDEFVKELQEKGDLSQSNTTKFIYLAAYNYIKHDIEVCGLTQDEVFKKYKLLESGITQKNSGAVTNRPLENLNECNSYRMFKKDFIEKYDSELTQIKNLDDVFNFIKKHYKNSDEFAKLNLCL